ncbi:hypothetical protein Tco_0233265 [Tanacetum coccineum]
MIMMSMNRIRNKMMKMIKKRNPKEMKSDEEQGLDDTIDQFDDDVDARLEEPTKTDTGNFQGEGTDAEMTEAQQGNENLEKGPVASSSLSSDLATKFLNFLDIPQTDAKIVSPLDVHVHYEVPRSQAPTLLTIPATPTPPPTIETTNPLSNLPDFSSIFRFNDRITTLEKEVVDLKKDPLHTQVASLVDSHLDTRFCPKKCPNLLRTLIEMLIERINVIGSYSNTVLHTQSTYELHHTVAQKDKDKDEDPSAFGSNRVKKRKDKQRLLNQHEPTEPDWKVGKTTIEGPTQTWLMNLAASNSSDKTLKDFDELMSTLINFSSFVLNGLKINNLTQEILLGPAFRLLKGMRSNYAELEYNFEECYKNLSEKLDWENPEGGDYPFDLSKPFPLITRGKRQRVPFKFFINNDLKYRQGGISTMTYTTSTTKTKAAQYDLLGIEDMSIYAFARVMQSKGDVYSPKRILVVTYVSVMRKHGYEYLEEIVVRRADNLTNLSGDDVVDFAIALRMFTRSLVIQKRVEDLQLGVESYQKKINVTKPDTTRPDLRKRHPYTPYKDPKGFIYVDDHKRNRHNKEYRHDVLSKEKVEQLGKEKSSFHDQRHRQAAEGKKDDEELRKIHRFYTSAGNPVKEILLKLNLPDHRSILTDSKEYLKMVMEFSKKQTALAISTPEAEYLSARKLCQQALWMKQALIDYDIWLDDVPIMCDNKGEIDLSKNPMQYSRTKHIEIRHHFLRDNVQKGHISIEKVSSEDNISDILAKPLKRESFKLSYVFVPMIGPYQTNPSSPDDVIANVREEREGQLTILSSRPSYNFCNLLKPFLESPFLNLHDFTSLNPNPSKLHTHLQPTSHFSSSYSSFLTFHASTQASSFQAYKKIKLTIIPPRQIFVDLTNEDDSNSTPSPITTSSSPTPPNAPTKTPSTKDSSSTFGTTSSSFESKPKYSPPSSSEPSFPKPSNLFLYDLLDVPPRPSNPIPLQMHPSLDTTLSLSPTYSN